MATQNQIDHLTELAAGANLTVYEALDLAGVNENATSFTQLNIEQADALIHALQRMQGFTDCRSMSGAGLDF
ncbi:MAG: hypothetical protein NTX50_16445 [Candidatus Sumerlaeota bacterium]|nr:hypothetical protein [Candidatus Sumerlaeota bacterium]